MKTAIRVILAAAAGMGFAATAAAQSIYGIGTNPQGTLGYSTATAISKVLSEKSGIRTQPQPVGGSSTYLPMVNRGNLDFGFANVAETLWAYKGEEAFTGQPNPNLRQVFVTYPISVAMSVAYDSPYKTIADLKGARGPSEYTAQTIFRTLQEAALATAGLSTADLQTTPVRNFVDALKLVGSGRLDTAITGPATGIAQETHSALSRRGGLRHLPIDTAPESIERMRAIMPGAYAEVIKPAPNMPGVREPIPAVTYSNFMMAGAHVPEETVYQVLKTLHANKPALVEAFAVMRGFDPDRMNEAHEVPYHPGAERFYREIGQWPPKAR
jgi:uncharacterized protein